MSTVSVVSSTQVSRSIEIAVDTGIRSICDAVIAARVSVCISGRLRVEINSLVAGNTLRCSSVGCMGTSSSGSMTSGGSCGSGIVGMQSILDLVDDSRHDEGS